MPINLTNLNHRLPKSNYSSQTSREKENRLPCLSTRSEYKSSRQFEKAGLAIIDSRFNHQSSIANLQEVGNLPHLTPNPTKVKGLGLDSKTKHKKS